ncbi:MAG: hypothetical protein ABFQ65_00615 [Nanoarchaeota archaeon]
MKRKIHLIFLVSTFVAWLLFYLLGIQFNYFLDFNSHEIFNLMFITFFAVIPFITLLILSLFGTDYIKDSIWLAFYASVPLFIYDYIVIGLINGEGFNFLKTHWFLTAGYFLVWIFMPLTGVILSKLFMNKK